VPASKRVLFFCGQLGVMALVRFFFTWSLKYSDQEAPSGELLFTASLVGLALLVARLLDGGVDPFIGRLADRWVARGHDRRTFLLFSFVTPPVGLALSFYATFAEPPGVRWACLLLGMLLLFTGYSLYSIPYWSLVDDYAGDDPKERGVLSNLLGAGLLTSVAVVSVVSPGLVADRGYRTAALAFAGAAVVLMVLPYFARPRGAGAARRSPPSGPADARASPAQASIGRQLLAIARHRRFVAMLVLLCGSQMALSVITSAAPFIVERLLGGTERDVAKVMTPFLGTAIPFFALAPWFSRRVGWQRAMVAASMGLVVVYVGTGFLGAGVIGTPMTTAMILFGCGGPMVAVLLGVEAEAISTCSREAGGDATGLYFGVANFMIQALNGVATFVTGLLVTASRVPGREVLMTRMMSVSAGIMLVVGIALYALVRPRTPARVVASERVA
jgi:Na+/melibiose symporter-like transporter